MKIASFLLFFFCKKRKNTWTDKGDLSGSGVWMLIICFQTVSNEYNSVIAMLDEWIAFLKPANYITHNATTALHH